MNENAVNAILADIMEHIMLALFYQDRQINIEAAIYKALLLI